METNTIFACLDNGAHLLSLRREGEDLQDLSLLSSVFPIVTELLSGPFQHGSFSFASNEVLRS